MAVRWARCPQRGFAVLPALRADFRQGRMAWGVSYESGAAGCHLRAYEHWNLHWSYKGGIKKAVQYNMSERGNRPGYIITYCSQPEVVLRISKRAARELEINVTEVKTPLDIYLQRHSPLSPDLWLHYSRLSARYISRHVPGADISLYPVSSYLSKWIKPGAK